MPQQWLLREAVVCFATVLMRFAYLFFVIFGSDVFTGIFLQAGIGKQICNLTFLESKKVRHISSFKPQHFERDIIFGNEAYRWQPSLLILRMHVMNGVAPTHMSAVKR